MQPFGYLLMHCILNRSTNVLYVYNKCTSTQSNIFGFEKKLRKEGMKKGGKKYFKDSSFKDPGTTYLSSSFIFFLSYTYKQYSGTTKRALWPPIQLAYVRTCMPPEMEVLAGTYLQSPKSRKVFRFSSNFQHGNFRCMQG